MSLLSLNSMRGLISLASRGKGSGAVAIPPAYLAIIAWHQSNMVGGHRDSNGAALSSPADDGMANLWQWSPTGGTTGQEAFANTLLPATVPLRFSLYGAADYANLVSPAMAYAKAVAAAYPTQQVVIIPAGRGGTNMSEWTPGQPYYVTTQNSWNAFRAAYPDSVLHSMIASPLENEMISVAAPSSVSNILNNLITGWRALAGASNTPIYFGSAVPAYVTSDNSRAILLEGAKKAVRTPLMGVSGGLTGGSVGGDTVHYTNTANRTRGAWLYDQIARTASFQTSVPQVTDLVANAEQITFTSVGVPYYLIQWRPFPGGGAWTNVEFVPNQDNAPGQVITMTMPGTGERECRVIAMGYGGSTVWYTEGAGSDGVVRDYRGGAASAAVTYTVPVVTVPTPYLRLDMPNAVTSGGNYVSVPSTDGGTWLPGVTAIPTFDIDPGAGVYNVPAMSVSRRFDRTGFTFPAGDFSFLVPVYYTTLGATLVAWKQASALGDIMFQLTSGGNILLRFVNASSGVTAATTTTPLAGQTGKNHCVGVTYNRTLNEAKIYLNGALLLTSTGLMTQRAASPSNSGGTTICGYNADTPTNNGLAGRLLDFYHWTSVLTQAQLQAQQAATATALGVTFG